MRHWTEDKIKQLHNKRCTWITSGTNGFQLQICDDKVTCWWTASLSFTDMCADQGQRHTCYGLLWVITEAGWNLCRVTIKLNQIWSDLISMTLSQVYKPPSYRESHTGPERRRCPDGARGRSRRLGPTALPLFCQHTAACVVVLSGLPESSTVCCDTTADP